MTTEILQFITAGAVVYGTWKVTDISKAMGRIEAIMEIYKDKFKEHDERLTKLERGDQAPGRPDGQRPAGFGGRLATSEG